MSSRFFLIGCPRSGTTLLQSMLTAHPQVTSFPESHFFRQLIPYNYRYHRLGIASKRAKPRLQKFLEEIDRKDMLELLPRFAVFQDRYIEVFLKILDTITQEQKKSIWIEKTPGHVKNIDYIEKKIEQVRFIHIIRNGADVIASLYEVTHNYPQMWHGEWSIDRCITQWVEDVNISFNNKHKSNHLLVFYEDLVGNPQLVISQICDFMQINFANEMLEKGRTKTQDIILDNEPWKANVKENISNRNGKKFKTLFDSKQQSYILNKISKLTKQFIL